jgi:hypothetical protein
MNRNNRNEKPMINHCQPARFVSVAALVLVTIISVVQLSAAAGRKESVKQPPITMGQLKGKWQVTLIGTTGCGSGTSLVNFTLNSKGTGSATVQSHTSGCGDIKSTGLPFAIQSLHGNGSGVAGLSCGSGCGWTFNIQVNDDGKIFNLVDVNPGDPGNYLEGVAIHQ